jgi:hypothetical protein
LRHFQILNRQVSKAGLSRIWFVSCGAGTSGFGLGSFGNFSINHKGTKGAKIRNGFVSQIYTSVKSGNLWPLLPIAPIHDLTDHSFDCETFNGRIQSDSSGFGPFFVFPGWSFELGSFRKKFEGRSWRLCYLAQGTDPRGNCHGLVQLAGY